MCTVHDNMTLMNKEAMGNRHQASGKKIKEEGERKKCGENQPFFP